MSLQVSKNKIVSIHYMVTDAYGEQADNNLGFEPLHYLHGAGNIIPALEAALEGAVEHECRQIILTPEQAYGAYQDDLVVEIDRQMATSSDGFVPGNYIELLDGSEVEVVAVSADQLVVNRNHPLAGMQLQFNVTIQMIRHATAMELLSGRAGENEFCGPECSCHSYK